MTGGTGRCGDLTVYRVKDDLICRTRRHYCSGYQKDFLRAQSVALANISNLWHRFPDKCKPCFTPLPEKRGNYQRFVAMAYKGGIPMYLEKQSDASVVTSLAVSGGTLASVATHLEEGIAVTDIRIGDLPLEATTTVAELTEAVLELNPLFEKGDRLLFYKVLQKEDPHGPYAEVTATELTLVLWDRRPLGEAVDDLTGFANRQGYLGATESVTGGVAWVHLRPKEEDIVLRSTQFLVVDNPLLATYSSPEQQRKAIASRVKDKGHLKQIFIDMNLIDERRL